MSEMTELTAPETAAPAEEKPKRRLWPLLAWGAIAAVVVVAGTVAALGTTGALIAGGCTAAAAAGAAVLWRLPQLRKHFAGPRRGARMRSLQSRTRRMSLGGGSGRKGKLPGLGGKGKLAGAGRKGKGPGIGKALSGKGKAAGKSPAGKMRAAGKSLLGKGAGGGKPKLGKLGLGKGRKPGGGNAAGGGIRGGLARRGGRRVMAGARKLAGRHAAAGKKAGRSRAAAALLPVAAAVAGGKRIRRWIRRRRGKGTADGQEKASPAADKPAGPADESPPPARQPGLPLAPDTADHPSRRKHPVSNQLGDTAEAIHQGIGAFEPENVADLGTFLQSLPQVYEALTSGLIRLADRFGDELPLHPAVVEHIRELASSAAGQHEYASEAHQIFVTSHEAELERLDNPRPGERLWDVVENQ